MTPVSGIPATCAATDDFDHALGDPAERMLATAIAYRVAASCPALTMVAALMNAPAQDPNALNADMEFVGPLETVKLYRTGK